MSPRRGEHDVGPMGWLLAGAILLAAIGGAIFVTQWRPMTPTRPGIERTMTPPPAGQYRIPLERPPMELPANLQYGGAIAAYHSGDFAAAARLLDAVSRSAPGNPQTEFYLGVSRLLAGDPRGAVDPLNASVRLSPGAAGYRSRWFLAIAYERSGRPAEATALLEGLCTDEGPRSRACNLTQ